MRNAADHEIRKYDKETEIPRKLQHAVFLSFDCGVEAVLILSLAHSKTR